MAEDHNRSPAHPVRDPCD